MRSVALASVGGCREDAIAPAATFANPVGAVLKALRVTFDCTSACRRP